MLEEKVLYDTPALDALIESMAWGDIDATVGRTDKERFVRVNMAVKGTYNRSNPTYATYYIFDDSRPEHPDRLSLVTTAKGETIESTTSVKRMVNQFYKMEHVEDEEDGE